MNGGKLYVVWGYVAGTVLPPNVTSGDIRGENWFRITHEVPDSFRRLHPRGSVDAEMPDGTWVTGSGRRLRVLSPAVFQVPVRVEDPDLAMPTAEDTILPRHLAATSAMTGSPLYGVPVAFHAADEWESWLPRLSEARVDVFQPGQLDLDTVDTAEWSGVVWASEHDATARQAAKDLYVGNYLLHCHTNDAADVGATLLNFFFVLERIANYISGQFPLTPEAQDSTPAISKLERGLEESQTVEEKVQVVRKAAKRLQEIHSRGMKSRVKEAGLVLGLDPHVTQAAGEFVELRHAKLGHVPSAGKGSAALIDWLPKAQGCAHTYLSAYLRWVGARGIASPN